jgi:hypothetical protein
MLSVLLVLELCAIATAVAGFTVTGGGSAQRTHASALPQ